MQRFSKVLGTPASSMAHTGPESRSHPRSRQDIITAAGTPSIPGAGAAEVVNNNDPEKQYQLM